MTARGDKKDLAALLASDPMAFVSQLEHDLRGAIGTLEGWWTILSDPAAREYHQEARANIPDSIDTLIDIADLIKQYKDRHRGQS